MKIAFLGIRGIPANYGGFETFVEAVSTRLAARGHKVSVYSRASVGQESKDNDYQGVKIIHLPAIKTKHLDTISHTFISTLHVIWTDAEIVYYCNAINSIFLILPRLFGKKVVINVDGLEWKRKKWNWVGRLAYQISEWIATLFANEIISDSKRIQLYYLKKFKRKSTYISYGTSHELVPENSEDILKNFGLQKRNYFLYVSRLEPENNAHMFVKAYEQVETEKPLIIVGGSPYGHRYMTELKATKDSRIRFLGFVYDAPYRILVQNAYVYFHGNEVGGTNPALLEAMAAGNCVIATGVGFNREVVGDAGLSYKRGNINHLKGVIEFVLEKPDEVKRFRKLARERVHRLYNWDSITDQYEEFFKCLSKK